MKRVLTLVFMLTLVGAAGAAEPIKTPADAFNAGKDFANTGKGAAGEKINRATGTANLPYYGTTAPEAGHFQGGRHPISGAGATKQTQCQTNRAPDGFRQQECDAVNFLTKNPGQRPKYTIDKKTDPLLTGSKETIQHPGAIPGHRHQQCRVETIKTPATFMTETCTEANTLEDVSCQKTLSVTCRSPYPGCASGGVIAGTFYGDHAYSSPDQGIQVFGVTQSLNDAEGNYGVAATYQNSVSFTIKNHAEMTDAVLHSITGGTSWRSVDVNGRTVYSETGDGGRVYRCNAWGARVKLPGWGGMFSYLCSDSAMTWMPENAGTPGYWQYKRILQMRDNYGANPPNASPQLNLLPYLHDGINTITVNATTGGYGYQGGGVWNVRLLANRQCDPVCTDDWDNGCASLEARSQ